MRRVYRRRADMMVFATIAAISVGVLGVYYEMKDQHARQEVSTEEQTVDDERLVILATSAPPVAALDPDVLAAEMPALLAALAEAARTGSAAIEDPIIADAVWLHLAERYGAAPRSALVVGFEGASYLIQASG